MTHGAISSYWTAIQKIYALGNATEHSYRPASKTLLEAIIPNLVALNELRRVECGAPDFVLMNSQSRIPLSIGFVEAKDIGGLKGDIENSEQIVRYRRALSNLILTDGLEFRWYVDGTLRLTATLGKLESNRVLTRTSQWSEVQDLLQSFLEMAPQHVNNPRELAEKMARTSHMIRDIIVESFRTNNASDFLRGWRKAFSDVLLEDLEKPERIGEFADMMAQTLAYGLFSARVMNQGSDEFSRYRAQRLIPRTNPFLRRFFASISGIELDDEPFVGFVDDLASLLALTDMATVLSGFGRRKQAEDPVVHFYETFLTAYDPKLRELRGVYYTPTPVVSFMVRSTDALLKGWFGIHEGLSDSTKISGSSSASLFRSDAIAGQDVENTRNGDESLHRVLILDPACGTATFPYMIIDHIRSQFMERGNAGLWSGYVREHLLPRLFAFELLMAPYAVAHFKLGLTLAGRDLPVAEREQWAYDFATDDRLRIYLTNTLEGPHESGSLPGFTQYLADENNAASMVKRDLPIMIVIGNPPYSGHSANKGKWINTLLRGGGTEPALSANYFEVDGRPLGERNSKWLNDDYVKFIRFGQLRIQQTGSGILALITNNGYLDNPTFRGMRKSLLKSFNEIYVLDLHGNSRKLELSPDGERDENVFDIMQGVAITLFVKLPDQSTEAQVFHADLWGKRDHKYQELLSHDVSTILWDPLEAVAPNYVFRPRELDKFSEYSKGLAITQVLLRRNMGPNSHRDAFAVSFDRSTASKKLTDFTNFEMSNDEIRTRYHLKDTSSWSLDLARRRVPKNAVPVKCIYRPFDFRFMLYGEYAFDRPRRDINDDLLRPNLSLITTRQTKQPFSALVSNLPAGQHKLVTSYDGSYVFPLYRYPSEHQSKYSQADVLAEAQNLIREQDPSLGWTNMAQAKPLVSSLYPDVEYERLSNLSPFLIHELRDMLELDFVPNGKGDLRSSFGPEDIFNYMYAILYSPIYRERFAEFLKEDFPKIPFTSNLEIFEELSRLGEQLAKTHILEDAASDKTSDVSFPVNGSNVIETIAFRPSEKQIWINTTQYFSGVSPEAWSFQIGDYQVAEKWLKDRKGRALSYDDSYHYIHVLSALSRTLDLMRDIDRAIDNWDYV